ncbi:LacI family DNA-binding transcriptional regulator [Actinopolymorpha alba]|uniref:LacI family DNA-binding transcriptional regulator n=1 Tax=Actinopolymorpha alba TaxID=533267 RepID=UPI0003709B78|nr:LacI family DNA-binding transcriptional regulator [Actinopolymorpha alba]
MRVRQADIARRAGVSQATVSMVINGRGDAAGIPAETQRRVLEASRSLGYVPNPVARNLRGKRTNLLGVHSFEAVFPLDRRDYYYEFLLGIEEEAESAGYDLVLFTSAGGEPDRRRRIYRDGVKRLTIADGSILLGVHSDRDELLRLVKDGYPFVHIGRRDIPGATIPFVTTDYARAVEQVVDNLLRLGHRRILYAGSEVPIEPQHDRRKGFRAALAAHKVRTGRLVQLPPDAVTADWLKRLINDGYTAVLLEGLPHARQALTAAAGVAIPDDLSVVVLDSPPSGTNEFAAWSTLRIPRTEMGRAAVRLLLSRLDQPTKAPVQLVLPSSAPAPHTIATPART